MSDNPELISQFTAITGVDEERAKFYLESSAWKLDVSSKNFQKRYLNIRYFS
jgi:UBX domain-containing protein 1